MVEVGETRIRECPRAKRFALSFPEIDRSAVKASIENRIRAGGYARRIGMCSIQRSSSAPEPPRS